MTTFTGYDVLTDAKKYYGTPYLWGGTDPRYGLDCSALVQLVFKDLGVSLPRVTTDQVKSGTSVRYEDAQPGDLLFFGRDYHHVGIYAGNGMMVDAPSTGKKVGLHAVSGYDAVTAVRRILPSGSSGGSGAITTGVSNVAGSAFNEPKAFAIKALFVVGGLIVAGVGLSQLGVTQSIGKGITSVVPQARAAKALGALK